MGIKQRLEEMRQQRSRNVLDFKSQKDLELTTAK